MKKIKYIILCLLAMFALYSCKKPSADDNPNPRPGYNEDNGDDEPDIDITVEYFDITSIYSLNSDASNINSHAGEWKRSSLELDRRSLVAIETPTLLAVNARYPRIKRLPDDTYLLIYQQGKSAHDVYYATSDDMMTWKSNSIQLFAKTDMNQYESAVSDRVLFTSADAIILKNGDILAFASFRLNQGYRLNPLNNGIMMRRSKDNGKTWSEGQIIYRGWTWEPHALQLTTDEVQLYFTSSNPNKGDSGTGLLRSFDNGETWISIGKIIRQKSGTAIDNSGDPVFTDQMCSPIQLNGLNRIATALESRFGTGDDAKYHITFAYSDDNWADGALTGEAEGPADRKSKEFLNEASPYMEQFPSGETILSTNRGTTNIYRMGNSLADQWGTPFDAFYKGNWASVFIESDHVMLGTCPVIANDEKAGIQVAKFILNHRINATKMSPALTADAEEWKGVKDALFIGSVSQCQVAMRFAYDTDSLYCFIERQDNSLTAMDGLELYFQSGAGSGTPFKVVFSANAAENTFNCETTGVSSKVRVSGKFGSKAADGVVYQISIPLTSLNIVSDTLLFNAVVKDESGDDTFTGVTLTDYTNWIPVVLAKQKIDIPEPGEDDYTGDTPNWQDGELINPWN